MPGSVPVGVQVLGPVAVGGPTGWQAVPGQQGLVLAVLAATHPRSVSTDALLDELWGDCPPVSAGTGLRAVLTRLRKRLGGDAPVLVRGSGGYRLELAEDGLDHRQFLRRVELATATLAEHPDRAATLLRPALALWRGHAFAPFTESDRVRAHAVHLEEQRRHAEELLVSALLGSGRPGSAAAWATELVEAEPYREHRWEQLMLALYRCGRQAEALQAARRATQLVRDDLGIEPWPGLRALEGDILQQAPHLDHRRADDDEGGERAASTGERGRAGVPAMRGGFVDRDADVAALTDLLAREQLITLIGPPGVGKSQLAAHLAEATVDRPVIWFDLVPVDTDAVLVEAALQLLRARAAAGAGAATGRCREDLVALVEQVDRLPLSLELVAPALDAIPPRELAARLAGSLEPAAARGQPGSTGSCPSCRPRTAGCSPSRRPPSLRSSTWRCGSTRSSGSASGTTTGSTTAWPCPASSSCPTTTRSSRRRHWRPGRVTGSRPRCTGLTPPRGRPLPRGGRSRWRRSRHGSTSPPRISVWRRPRPC